MSKYFSYLLISLIATFSTAIHADNDNFSLTDINGHQWHKSELKDKYIIVNFWATWCPPCLKEIPLLIEIAEDHPDDVVILGINAREKISPTALKDFMELYYVNYPIFRDTDNAKAIEVFGLIHGIPTTFFFNKQGELFEKIEGELTQKMLKKLIPDIINIL